jgi:hypothetical protein
MSGTQKLTDISPQNLSAQMKITRTGSKVTSYVSSKSYVLL